MNYNDLVETKYRIPQDEFLDEHMTEIIAALNRNPDKVVIECREIDSTEVYNILKDPTFLQDEYLHITDEGIKILTPSPLFFNKIKQYLPKTLRELTISRYCLSDLETLQEFPNLESLNFSDYSSLETAELELLRATTSIKKVNLRSSSFYYKHRNEPNYTMICGGPMIADYKGLKITHMPHGKWTRNQSLYIDSLEDLSIAKRLYSEIRNELPTDSLISIYESGNDQKVMTLTIDPNNEATTLNVKHVPAKPIANVYNSIKKEIPIAKVNYETDNKTLEDAHYLNSITKNSDFRVAYSGTLADATLAEYQDMRGAVDYYKGLIEDANLSPLEQVTYVYDIMKTFRYNEHSSDKQRSRSLHGIIADGTIVCVGYAAFVEEILNELGVKTISYGTAIPTEKNPLGAHQRNLLRIDDDKYNIHGVFALDATWDSDKDIAVIEEDNERLVISRPTEEDNVIDTYDNLSLYRYFLIPMSDYDSRYPGEIDTKIIQLYKNNQVKELVERCHQFKDLPRRHLNETEKTHLKLFDPEEGALTVNYYLSTPKPSLETFKEILTTVRRAEGYSKEAAQIDTNRVVELHDMLNEQNEDEPNHFFKPKKSK